MASWRPALASLVLLTACGQAAKPLPPLAVDSSLVPKKLNGGQLGVYENTAPATIAAFANVGSRALISDGRVWEIRRNDRLVASLQISAMKQEVDLGKESLRSQILSPILLGDVQVIRLANVEVEQVPAAGRKDLFVWFGQHYMEVLQVKDAGIAPRDLVTEIIVHQQTTSAWAPLSSSEDSDPNDAT